MNRMALAGLAALAAIPLIRAYRRGQEARRLPARQPARLPERWPSVSIIIPAWRERGMLEACLAQLRKVDYEDFEVIVVAGGEDGTREAACERAREDRRVRVMYQRTAAGKNGAMNDGARQADSEILVFLDADSLVAPDWLKNLIAAMGDEYAASTGRFIPMRRSMVSRTTDMTQILENEARRRVILQGGGSVAVRRSAFEAVGGIPEGSFADDWALSSLLKEAGYRVAYAPDALLCSERPATLSEWWRNEVRWRRTHLLTLFHVAREELQSPVSAIKALYPYGLSWGILVLGVASVLPGAGLLHYRSLARAALLGLVSTGVTREVAGAVETAAYTGQPRWLGTAVMIPILTGLSWLASVIATLTTGKTELHFKGPRTRTAQVPPEVLERTESCPVLELEAELEPVQ